MRFSLSRGLGSSPAAEAPPSPRTYRDIAPGKSDQRLSFWYIRQHDRESLIDRIIPHIAEPIAKTYFLDAIVDRHSWAEELIKSELTEPTRDGSDCFRQTIDAFWQGPATTADELLRLSRVWFFILLRYTYRCRFFNGREVSRSDMDVRILYSSRNDDFCSALTEETVRRLTRLQSKYGASYYRRSYKDAKRRLGWTSFCDRIRSFCQSLGLHTSSNDPEQNLKELRHNLTSIMMHRKLSYVNNQLSRSIVLVRNTRRFVKKIDERMTSGAMHEDEVVQEMKQEMKELNCQIEKLQLARAGANEAPYDDPESVAEIMDSRTAYEKKFEELDRGIQRNDESSKQLIQSLQTGVEELRNEFGHLRTSEKRKTTAEALILCRWLLEHLPTGHVGHDGLAFRWRRFWRTHWGRCQELKRTSHPLWELMGDEDCNRIGQGLYGTLSKRIHGYGAQTGDALRPEVQRVVDAIKPVHYHDDGKINLKAERMRWTD